MSKSDLIDMIFRTINQKRFFAVTGYEVHFKKWQWFVNGEPVSPEAMRDSVFAYVNGIE